MQSHCIEREPPANYKYLLPTESPLSSQVQNENFHVPHHSLLDLHQQGGARVLRPGGCWIILSFNAPGVFLPALQTAPGILWRTSTLGRLHLYTGTKV